MIYLDNAATTSLAPEVLDAMKPWLQDDYMNPMGVYRFAQKGHAALEKARRQVAELINADPKEIYFTSGGSEGDNWSIKGTALAMKDTGRHIITTKIEHHAVLHTCQFLEKLGWDVTYLDVDSSGYVSPQAVEKAIRPDTVLISIMMANNEVGTIEPVAEIAEIAREHGIIMHTDAVQACGHIPIDVKAQKIDLMSVSGHKFHGPKGIGFQYIRGGLKIENLIHGGDQERTRRAGTHNMPGIIGLARACELAGETHQTETARLRNYMIKRLTSEIPCTILNGPDTEGTDRRLPNNVNVSFRYVEGESVLIMLDQAGICASSGSACTSGSVDPSHVLLAMGRDPGDARSAVRFTLSELTTKEDIDRTVEVCKKAVSRLRTMSDAWKTAPENH